MGIGIVHDSVFYLSGADNLSAGRGLTWNAGGEELRPLVHFPPGYSIILAALSDIPASALGAAAAIQIAALATSVVLIGALIFLGSGDRFLAVLGAVIAGASPILFERYLDVRSEPLFLVFLLGSIAVLIRYLETGDNQLFWGAGALTAAAAAFRYAGLAALGSRNSNDTDIGAGCAEGSSRRCGQVCHHSHWPAQPPLAPQSSGLRYGYKPNPRVSSSECERVSARGGVDQ